MKIIDFFKKLLGNTEIEEEGWSIATEAEMAAITSSQRKMERIVKAHGGNDFDTALQASLRVKPTTKEQRLIQEIDAYEANLKKSATRTQQSDKELGQ